MTSRKVQTVSEYGVSRRNLICGFVAAGAAVPLVAACGGSDSPTGSPSAAASTPGGSTPSTPGGGATTAAAGSIQTSEIPVGGGKIFADRGIVVTQPTAGEFKAFSSSCTHQGAKLDEVSGGALICPLHGSKFSVEDGSVEQGPATSALKEFAVVVTGDTLEVTA